MYFGRNYNKGYVHVYGELLRDEIGSGHVYGENTKLVYTIREHLKEWGVIDWYNRPKGAKDRKQKIHVNNHGKVRTNIHTKKNGKVSTCDGEVYYRIQNNWFAKGFTRIQDCKELSKLHAQIIKINAKEKYLEKANARKQRYTGVYKELEKTFLKIRLDIEGAQKRLNLAKSTEEELSWQRSGKRVYQKKMTKELACYYQMFIDRFNNDKFFHVDYKTGRIYSTLSNLPKMLRPYLRIDGKPFVELDISNSQPLILCLLYRKWCEYNRIDVQPDGIEYQILCETGQFYYNFENYVNDNNVPVFKTFKTDVFTRIFFNKEYGSLTQYQRLFKTRFPSVFQCIQDIKKPHYKEVAKKLQKYEADLIIKKIANRLLEEGITTFYTIHDCIAITPEYQEMALKVMHEEFENEGIEPRIKVEDYSLEGISSVTSHSKASAII